MHIALEPALHLLHRASHAVLASHSGRLPGFPYATAVPLIVDARHHPVLLLSALAEHTRNLLLDARASLAVIDPSADNVQDADRLTLVGRITPCPAEPALIERYLRYLPAAAQYLELDFGFFRMHVEDARHIAGIGRMGWLDAARWSGLPSLSADQEKALILQCSKRLPAGWQLLGIDAHGTDLVCEGRRHRLPHPISPASFEQLDGLLASTLEQINN